MTDITYFFNDKAIIKRVKSVGDNKYRMSATATADCNIQHLSQDDIAKIEGTFGVEYVGFFESSTNLKEGDRIVNKDDGNEYVVKTVVKAELFGIQQFLEVYMTKFNGN
jgi:hypothetical protein